MKFIAIELGAIDELISNRFLQSVEFEQGKAFSAILTAQIKRAVLSPKLEVTKADDGVFITVSSISLESRFLILDLEQSRMFQGVSDADTLFITQKLMRFAKKIWEGLALNFAERIFSGTTKAVLFPFRGYEQSPYRVTIEREPWGDRLAKRGHRGNFLLAYKAGREGGDAARENAELTNFRKAYEAIPEVRQRIQAGSGKKPAQSMSLTQLQVLELEPAPVNSSSLYRSLDDWLPLLTTQQRRFVEQPINGPYRIEGAAGTGKTLSLMLKAVCALRTAQEAKSALSLVFVTHSDATKRTIQEVLSVIDTYGFTGSDRNVSSQTLKVCTLSELCAEELRQSISESEFIDRDAMESKGLQLLYISEALQEAMRDDFPSHERFLTPGFASFMKSEESWRITEMFQHEISVVIKGRASEDLNRYKKLPTLRYGLPIGSDADKGFAFTVFRLYQDRLGAVGQFDTDDVVLTAIGQLDTPIWRRRRMREGFDAIFIDETHLFNINELHLFHFFTKKEGPYPIIYSVDRSQAVGDKGWTSADIAKTLTDQADSTPQEREERMKTIFRSSPDIVNLAFSIVSAGATLFTNFDNPLEAAASAFTDAEERLTAEPCYLAVPNDEAMIEHAFSRAEQLQKELGCKRSQILIVTLDEKLLDRLATFATERNKAHLLLKRRGDALAVESASVSGQFVIGHADYVGGLEFFAVILVGIDNGRVPPVGEDLVESSKHFLSYAAHNRLYVAVSRAKYRVEILGEKARGPSKLLLPAINANLLQISDASL
ncbi:UvrD-helicase domain-containing protein [Sinorhizobium medicae]|uniref:UvrD-helicase domain-containing protein n=1 Tax=Sinorhizobium medicae TaxID=110321 RepID=UPI000FDA8974|nr:UvrD-helicase domain-containing protein [Sinorhizobium medicae]RVJ77339.1 hypothetical protein CN168_19520 [Sinorhizobium medicae]